MPFCIILSQIKTVVVEIAVVGIVLLDDFDQSRFRWRGDVADVVDGEDEKIDIAQRNVECRCGSGYGRGVAASPSDQVRGGLDKIACKIIERPAVVFCGRCGPADCCDLALRVLRIGGEGIGSQLGGSVGRQGKAGDIVGELFVWGGVFLVLGDGRRPFGCALVDVRASRIGRFTAFYTGDGRGAAVVLKDENI